MWFPGKQWGHPFYDAYRLIDIESGTDLKTVNIPRDWKKIKAGKYYSDKAACKYIMNHTDPAYDNRKKFLLSFTKTLGTARGILNWKKKSFIDTSRNAFYLPASRQKIARLDILTAWMDGAITSKSYADLSQEARWNHHCKSEETETMAMNYHWGIDGFAHICRMATRWQEILIGEKGDWWPPYCKLVDVYSGVV